MNRLRRYLLSSVSHMALTKALAAQAWAARNSGNTTASTTPSPIDRGEPSKGGGFVARDRRVYLGFFKTGAEALPAVAAARGAE